MLYEFTYVSRQSTSIQYVITEMSEDTAGNTAASPRTRQESVKPPPKLSFWVSAVVYKLLAHEIQPGTHGRTKDIGDDGSFICQRWVPHCITIQYIGTYIQT